MVVAGPNAEAEDREGKELVEALLAHARKFNEGNNGVVFLLDTNELSPELRAGFGTRGEGEPRVAKILKFYQSGSGLNEYKMQMRAYELRARSANPDEIARVPKPYLYRNLKITPELREKLLASGVSAGTEVELLIMDYVPGKDVGRILLEEVAKRHPKTVDIARDVDKLHLDELRERVTTALGYAIPKSTGRDAADQAAYAQERIEHENAEKLFRFLEESDFRFPPSIARQVRQAVRLFHANGLHLRDAHVRNVMINIEKNDDGTPLEEASIIDYGAAIQIDAHDRTDVYHEEDQGVFKRYISDEVIIHQIERLTAGVEQKRTEHERDLVRKELGFRLTRLKKQPAWATFERILEQAADAPHLLTNTFIMAPAIPDTAGRVKNFLAGALPLCDSRPDFRRHVVSLLEQRIVSFNPDDQKAARVFIEMMKK